MGSEGIYRGAYSEGDLLEWLDDMQKTFPSTLIGTADSWNGWANGSLDSIITSGIKLILANGFPYWQYQEINNATKTFFYTMGSALDHIQKLSGSLDDIHFMNGGKHNRKSTCFDTNWSQRLAGLVLVVTMQVLQKLATTICEHTGKRLSVVL